MQLPIPVLLLPIPMPPTAQRPTAAMELQVEQTAAREGTAEMEATPRLRQALASVVLQYYPRLPTPMPVEEEMADKVARHPVVV